MELEEIVWRANRLHGLCTTEGELRRLAELAKDAERVAEVGAYMGRSTLALALAAKGKVLTVDTWAGSAEDAEGEKTKEVSPEYLYFKFMSNLWEHIEGGKVIPLRCDSVEGAHIARKVGYNFDVIYIDAGHGYEWVTRDVEAWLPLLKPSGVMVGHDLPHPGMKDALNELLPGWRPSVGMLWEYKKNG